MLLSLANELKVLPTDLNRLLIIVVVLSMALTPFLAEAGKRFVDSTVSDDASKGAPNFFAMRTPGLAAPACTPQELLTKYADHAHRLEPCEDKGHCLMHSGMQQRSHQEC